MGPEQEYEDYLDRFTGLPQPLANIVQLSRDTLSNYSCESVLERNGELGVAHHYLGKTMYESSYQEAMMHNIAMRGINTPFVLPLEPNMLPSVALCAFSSRDLSPQHYDKAFVVPSMRNNVSILMLMKALGFAVALKVSTPQTANELCQLIKTDKAKVHLSSDLTISPSTMQRLPTNMFSDEVDEWNPEAPYVQEPLRMAHWTAGWEPIMIAPTSTIPLADGRFKTVKLSLTVLFSDNAMSDLLLSSSEGCHDVQGWLSVL
jgi:hypothetical protein